MYVRALFGEKGRALRSTAACLFFAVERAHYSDDELVRSALGTAASRVLSQFTHSGTGCAGAALTNPCTSSAGGGGLRGGDLNEGPWSASKSLPKSCTSCRACKPQHQVRHTAITREFKQQFERALHDCTVSARAKCLWKAFLSG